MTVKRTRAGASVVNVHAGHGDITSCQIRKSSKQEKISSKQEKRNNPRKRGVIGLRTASGSEEAPGTGTGTGIQNQQNQHKLRTSLYAPSRRSLSQNFRTAE
jgi:hypothetical protein